MVNRKPDLSSNRRDNIYVRTAFFHLIEIQYLARAGSCKKSRYFGRNIPREVLDSAKEALRFLMEMRRSHKCDPRLLHRNDDSRWSMQFFAFIACDLIYVNIALNVKLHIGAVHAYVSHVRKFIQESNITPVAAKNSSDARCRWTSRKFLKKVNHSIRLVMPCPNLLECAPRVFWLNRVLLIHFERFLIKCIRIRK